MCTPKVSFGGQKTCFIHSLPPYSLPTAPHREVGVAFTVTGNGAVCFLGLGTIICLLLPQPCSILSSSLPDGNSLAPTTLLTRVPSLILFIVKASVVKLTSHEDCSPFNSVEAGIKSSYRSLVCVCTLRTMPGMENIPNMCMASE